jgi:hypothetical protein
MQPLIAPRTASPLGRAETADARRSKRAVLARDKPQVFERGAAVLSIDTECIWGFLDKYDDSVFETHYPNALAITERLLTLLCQAGLSATWAVVGGLSLSGSAGPHDPRMNGLPESWVSPIRAGDEANAPLWYARSFIERIRDSLPAQDVGLHGGLTHMVWSDPATPREIICRELQAGIRALGEIGVVPRSFVFPRNVEGYHRLLASNGIRAYRGVGPALSSKLGRTVPGSIMRVVEELGRFTPPPVWPHERCPGLWNIPASLFLFRMSKSRAWMAPLATRQQRARLGLEAAARAGAVFHFWFHPENLAESAAGFSVFESIVEEMVRARRTADMEVLTMKQVADRMENGREDHALTTSPPDDA